MKTLTKFFAIAATFSALTFAGAASAQEAPDALVKRISSEVLDTAKSDKDIQAGNNGRIMQLVEQKILPYVDFERMTQLAAGRFWRQASPEQQKQLITEFRSLLVFTYSGALSQVRDQKIEFKPLRASPADTEVEVNSQVISSRGGEPIQLSYRLEKKADGWKLYDVNVLGAWLVEAYKGTFANEINKGGIDGLIKALSDKNKQLAARANKK
ncbi:ABC transporter substrate-binding protein [Herbaspirillum sp. LeCh32-8]|uniref:MlaC/ttg2D family ABC transporter substrate-binding protein n=1 Tax=Herbaspirillum sp. LeCh32-8 TaxID=2821356 RepID=UPI001AE996F4|nr:ABC transporter substrate-binding protein [Herbaspirillum sp. LeCh32-8]MBP0600047.1 ABC transporter substrate-binding protein [Herbaspirillum sp. LeCh32-8]